MRRQQEDSSHAINTPTTGDIQIMQPATEPVVPDNPSSTSSVEETENTTPKDSNGSNKFTETFLQLSNDVNKSLILPACAINSTLHMTKMLTPSNKNSAPVFFAKKSKPSPPPVANKDDLTNDEVDKPHSCPKCGQTFQRKEDWEIHDFNMFCMTLQ